MSESFSSTIFATLDAPFINFEKNVEPIIWQSKDILIMQTYDFKIPTMLGSLVKYSFSTTGGDINFSTEFHVPGQTPQVIVSPMRVPSDVETIRGAFKSNADGTFVFIFDNTYSWFNSKLLTYSANLFQPAFAIADNNRVRHSQRLLHSIVEDNRKAQLRLIVAKERSNNLDVDISSLDARILALTADLDNKKGILRAAKDEVEEMNTRIAYNLEKKNGLCIRCLDYKALSLVLSFLGKNKNTYLVSKYWKACIDDIDAVVTQVEKKQQQTTPVV